MLLKIGEKTVRDYEIENGDYCSTKKNNRRGIHYSK